MSFHIIRSVAKKQAKEAAGFFRKKPTRVDQDLPLGVAIDRLVDIDGAGLSTFIGLVQFNFPSFPLAVEAIGKIDLGEGAMAYRCYLQGTSAFLQVVSEHGDPVECRLYVLDRDLYPHSEEIWATWLNDEDGIIGSPEVLHGDGEERSYLREWMEGEGQTVPVQVSERIIRDSYGEQIYEETQQAMSYFRVASGDPYNPEDPERVDEFLLISAGDGVIELYLGVELMLEEVKVI
ncbi:MAG: DUF2491 family protein [Gemmatimonadetes bacterium]|nr:DUF2491 family protein [Gemmatimonadota bacterium]